MYPQPTTTTTRSVYSLIEIEHCILRARSASCNMFMSNWFTPRFDEKNVKWEFGSCLLVFGYQNPGAHQTKHTHYTALLKPEPSLNVGVLNFGSRSCLAQVPVLRLGDPPKLAKQLCACVAQFVREFVDVRADQKTVLLPRMCGWYLKDFSESDPPLAHGRADLPATSDGHGSKGKKRRLLAYLAYCVGDTAYCSPSRKELLALSRVMLLSLLER